MKLFLYLEQNTHYLMKKNSKYILFCFMFYSLSIFSISAQTIWTETFSNGCASGCLATSYGGWTQTTTGTNGAGANIWYISGEECGNAVGMCGSSCGSTDPSLHIGANENAPCTAWFCSNIPADCGAAYNDISTSWCSGISVVTNKRIQSPTINCSGYSNIMLSFNFIHNGNDGTNDQCSVEYYDGSTWTTLGVLPRTVGICSPQGYWTNYTIPLPASANNNPNVRIGFNWKNNANNAGSDPSVAIDDIVLYVKPNSCYNSAFAVYTGAGCTANCNLTEYAGFTSMCNGTSIPCSGSCPSATSSQYFTIPSGCSATLTASFQRRCNGIGCAVCSNTCNIMTSSSGCCNSGMDANDYLKVGGSLPPTWTNQINLSNGYTSVCGSGSASTAFSTSGNTITATGSNNGGAIIQYAQTGGVLFLEGRADRMDEIITFTINIASGCNCADIVLPVDIFAFTAELKNGLVELKWITKNEQHLSHYRIDKSTDGIHFSTIAKVPSENSPFEKTYSIIDDNPIPGITYYKLTPVNLSGYDEQFIMRDLLYQLHYELFTYEILQDDMVFHFHNFDEYTSFELIDLNGKKIFDIPVVSKNDYSISNSSIPKGIYLGVIKTKYLTYTQKIVVY
jgi:hypothetical protein